MRRNNAVTTCLLSVNSDFLLTDTGSNSVQAVKSNITLYMTVHDLVYRTRGTAHWTLHNTHTTLFVLRNGCHWKAHICIYIWKWLLLVRTYMYIYMGLFTLPSLSHKQYCTLQITHYTLHVLCVETVANNVKQISCVNIRLLPDQKVSLSWIRRGLS